MTARVQNQMHQSVESRSTNTDTTSSGSLVANSLTMFGGQIAIKVISFAFNLVVIRHLGSEQYGKYAICAAFGGLFAVLSDLGLAQLAVKRIARDRAPGLIASLISNIITLRVLLSLGVVLLTAIAAWMMGYSGELRFGIFIATLGLISYAFFGLADTIALGLERFRASAALNVSLQLSTLVLSATFVLAGAGFLGLLAATTIAVFIVALIGLRRFNREIPLRAPLGPRSWPTLVRDALPFAGITLALAVSYKADTVILSFAVPAALIGAYSVAYNLVFTCVTLSHSINLALFPTMAREYSDVPERAALLFRQGLRYLLFISLPVAIVLSLNADAIVRLLYGDRFADAALPLAILSWTIPLLFLSEFLGYVAIVVDRETLAARANWVSSAGNVAANLALIPFFGIVAAAIITVLTEVLLVGQYLIALREHRLFDGRWKVGATVAAAILLALLLLIMRTFAWPVVLIVLLGGVAYLLAALGLRAVGQEEIALVRRLVGRFQRKSLRWLASERGQ